MQRGASVQKAKKTSLFSKKRRLKYIETMLIKGDQGNKLNFDDQTFCRRFRRYFYLSKQISYLQPVTTFTRKANTVQ